jgi:pyruvate/2-oxoglutarate dehydrogenase complex dihydrolipoamide acyltransferase (E2) component
VNNNDDVVRLTKMLVAPGAAVRAGDIVAEVETDKANFTVEAEADGYVLAVAHELNQMIPVGSVLLWLGATPDEPVPAVHAHTAADTPPPQRREPTLKAAQMLARLGLRAEDIPASGERLSVNDIEAYVAKQRGPSAPIASGVTRPLTPEERAMVRTVRWQRDEAVPGYVEIQYPTAAWEQAAADYQRTARLLVSPLLSLMAWQLVRLAAARPELNSTIVGDRRHVYDVVNLGFTVQSERTLYLAVLNNAGAQTDLTLDNFGTIQSMAEFLKRVSRV